MRRVKKSVRMRGNSNQGYGSRKKNRGRGNKSGNKRRSKVSHIKKKSEKGFSSINNKRDSVINIGDLNKKIPLWLNEGKITKEGERYVIDLNKLNYDKLLGSGRIDYNVKINVDSYSAKAKEKVSKNGEILGEKAVFENKKGDISIEDTSVKTAEE